jgi:hypothetical protein
VGRLIFFILILEGWSGSKLDRFTDRLWCSVKYSAEWKNINVYKRPSDCDFTRVPLGSKSCAYKKHTESFGEKERYPLASQATTVESKQEYEKLPDSVSVFWQKKEE